MNRKRLQGINAPALMYAVVACLMLTAGCADLASKRAKPDKSDGGKSEQVDAYHSGYDTGDRFAVEYLKAIGVGAQAFSERLTSDLSKPAEKKDMPNGDARGKAWKLISEGARHNASDNVNRTAAPYLNEKDQDAPEWWRGFGNGVSSRAGK